MSGETAETLISPVRNDRRDTRELVEPLAQELAPHLHVVRARRIHARSDRQTQELDEDAPLLRIPRVLEQTADRLRAFRELGFSTLIPEMPAPYDVETIERLIGEVKPMVDAG